MTGTVDRFDTQRRYGFITADEDHRSRYFVHQSDVDGREVLAPGDRVDFDPIETERGPRATRVTILARVPES